MASRVLREFGLTLDGADAGRFAVAQEGSPRSGISAEKIALLADVVGDARRDRISVARQRDRGLERRRKRAAAMILDQLRPCLHCAGDGDGVRRVPINRGHAVALVPFRRRRHRRAS